MHCMDADPNEKIIPPVWENAMPVRSSRPQLGPEQVARLLACRETCRELQSTHASQAIRTAFGSNKAAGRRHSRGRDRCGRATARLPRIGHLLSSERRDGLRRACRAGRCHPQTLPEAHRYTPRPGALCDGPRLWVPRTLSWRLISAFATSRRPQRSLNPGQHDRSLWPSDSEDVGEPCSGSS
jgi:hypothetical protein